MKAYFCSISGNGDGVRNLIDSMMFGCTINANDRGVALTGGANNNFLEDAGTNGTPAITGMRTSRWRTRFSANRATGPEGEVWSPGRNPHGF